MTIRIFMGQAISSVHANRADYDPEGKGAQEKTK